MSYVIKHFDKDNGMVVVKYSNADISKSATVVIPKTDAGEYDAAALTTLLSDIESDVLANIPSNAADIEALITTPPDCEECARNRRNMLLSLSDWTQFSDNGLTQEQLTEASTYRQALRDVPTQSGFPESVTWPTLSFGNTERANEIINANMQDCGQ